jgi:1-acyl-sn-glycerol-3-phosphate acyltransferase
MRFALGKLYSVWFYLVFGGTFLLLYPLFRYGLANPKRYPWVNRIRRFWAKLIFVLMGCPWKIEGEELVDTNSTYIFCPNHSSNFDIPLFALSWNGHYAFLSKKEWGDIPVFGIFFRTIDLMVDRNSKIDGGRALVRCMQLLRRGTSLVVYPEGTMRAEGPLTEDFRDGPFLLAVRTGVAIVPISFVDNWRLFPRGGKSGGRPGRIRSVIHAPVDPAEFEGSSEERIAAMKLHVKQILDDSLKKHNPNKYIQ